MGTVILARSSLHRVAAPLHCRIVVADYEWFPGRVGSALARSARMATLPHSRPTHSHLGFAHSLASCPRVPGGGSRAGSAAPEPRASRFGSCTVRSCSRTRGEGSYHSRVLCSSGFTAMNRAPRGFPLGRGGVRRRQRATSRSRSARAGGSVRRGGHGRSARAPWSRRRSFRS